MTDLRAIAGTSASTTVSSDDAAATPLAWLLLGGALVFVTIALLLSAPIFPGDEYAYFVSGLFGDRLADVHRLDPWLQSVPNFLFFGLIRLVGLLAGSHLVPVFRIVHVAELMLAAFVLHHALGGLAGRRDALVGALLFLLMPTSLYLFGVMPEIELVLAAACTTWLVVVVVPTRAGAGSIGAGVVLGIALLMKPHAIAILAAVVVVVAIAPWFGAATNRATAAVRAIVLVLVSFYLTVVVCWRLFHPEWAFNPMLTLGLDLYGASVGGAANGLSIGRKVVDAVMYAAAHLAVIVLLFAPVVVWCGEAVARTLKSRGATVAAPTALLAFFVSVMLLSHVAMTAWFSAGVAASSEGEALRLHGRYLGAALALLAFVVPIAVRQLSPRHVRLAAGLGGLAVIVFLGLVRPGFKIYPWDHPLLFAYFAAPNHYGWDFEGSAGVLGTLLPWVVLCLFALAYWSKPFAKRALLWQFVLVVLVACVQTYAWAYRQSVGVRPLADAAKAVATIVGDDQFGKGLVVTDNRYGSGATVLFNLANVPRVLVREAGSAITAQDVDGASWILLGARYRADFDGAQSMATGPLRFFPLDSSAAISSAREKRVMAPGTTATVALSTGRLAPERLSGFNDQEVWGAWTARPTAEIELPFRVEGDVTLRLFGWALPENLGKPLRLRIGENAIDVALTDRGVVHELHLHVDRASDRIVLESPVFETAPDHRLGVAVGSISVTRGMP